MSLFEELINLKKAGKHKTFWGEYERLSTIDNEYSGKLQNNSILFQLQIQRLKTLENNSIRYNHMNNLLLNAPFLLGQYNLGEQIEDNVLKKVMSLLNAGLWKSSTNPVVNVPRDERLSVQQKTVEDLKMCLDTLGISSSLQASIVENLDTRLSEMIGVGGVSYEYVQGKARHAEELVGELFAQNAALKTFVTGNWKDKLGKSLIEDVMVFSANSPILTEHRDGLTFKIRIDGNDTSGSAESLQDFFNQLDNVSGSYSIVLSDPLYDLLQKASAFNVQAKTGLQQSILTNAKRNSISLNQLGFFPMQLIQLYNNPKGFEYFKKNVTSKTLTAYANYALSKGIAMTQLNRNELYFTKDGLTTASTWMQINQQMLKFTGGNIGLSTDFLKTPRRYQFENQ